MSARAALLRPFVAFVGAVLWFLTLAAALRAVFVWREEELWRDLPAGQLAAAFLHGLRFDASIAATAAAVAIALHGLLRLARLRRAAWWTSRALPGFGLVLAMAGDAMYFAETGKHVTYEIHNTGGDWSALVSTALHAHAVLLSLHLAVGALFLGALALRARARAARPAEPLRPVPTGVGSLLAIGLLVVLYRGGFQHVPLDPVHAFALAEPRAASIALNGAYGEFHALFRPNRAKHYEITLPPGVDARATVAALYDAAARRAPAGPVAAPPNIVVVLLEGWAARFMGAYGGRKEATPFFDALRARSLTSDLMVTDAHRTAMGIFAVFCSYQNPLGQANARTNLEFERYDSLPALLRARGWTTAFFQGTNRETAGTGSYAQSLGFEQSYGQEEMPPGRFPPHSWGRHDHDIYDFAIARLREAKRPFLAGINTNSTHSRELPPGVQPLLAGDGEEIKSVNSLHFCDDALREFIGHIEAGELGPTIVVLAADHTSYAGTDGFLGHAIPFLMLGPGIAPRTLPGIYHHRDIAPTLLELLGLPCPDGFMGRSLFGAPKPFADYFRNGALGWVEGDLVVEVPIGEPGRARAWDWRKDPEQKAPLPAERVPQDLVARAAAFSSFGQELLFRGRTREFRSVLHGH